MEKYRGVKFNVISINIKPPHINKLLKFSRIISKYLKTKDTTGNISIRVREGMIISPAGAKITDLKTGIFVKMVKKNTVYSSTGIPSSETIMHWMIYKKRKDINAILHFHNDRMLKVWNGKRVRHYPYGSVELAEAVSEGIEKCDMVKIEKHGFVIVGKDIKSVEGKLKNELNKLQGYV